MQNESKMRVLFVLEMLKNQSDFEHPLNANKISELLKEKGIKADRKAIYRDINALIDCGYDIVKSNSKKDGYYYDDRLFQLPEIRLLLDAVAGAPFITDKKTNQLSKKLLSLLSVHQRKYIKGNAFISNRNKFSNEEIYYNIDRINEAINEGKKISFIYYHKIIDNGRLKNNDGREFTVSPYGLFWADDRYYLAGNYEKYDTIANYRIDRMKKVTVLFDEVRPVSEISDYEEFDVSDYVKKNVMAFYSEGERVELSFENQMLDIITDKFGENNYFAVDRRDSSRITVSLNIGISEGLINWIIPFYDRIEIKNPPTLKKQVEERIKKLIK